MTAAGNAHWRLFTRRDQWSGRLSTTVLANCNFTFRLDNLRDDSKPTSCFQERSFNIWELDVSVVRIPMGLRSYNAQRRIGRDHPRRRDAYLSQISWEVAPGSRPLLGESGGHTP